MFSSIVAVHHAITATLHKSLPGLLLSAMVINVLLSFDNMAVILVKAAPFRGKRGQYWTVMVIGYGMAVGLRFVLSFYATPVLFLPYIQTVGALGLLWISLGLLRPKEGKTYLSVWAACFAIVWVDVLTSLDSLIAVAAIAGPHNIVATMGMILSMVMLLPLIHWLGSFFEGHGRFEKLLMVSVALLLAWLAGRLIGADPGLQHHWLHLATHPLVVWWLPRVMASLMLMLIIYKGWKQRASLPPK